jgi:predicted site-specific integrase-resolvase
MSKPQDAKRQEDEMTTGQAARLFDVSIQTIHNWINAGHLEAREVWQGRKRMRYVKRESADRWQAHVLSDRRRSVHGSVEHCARTS